jgi:hypothetical protein
MKKFTSSLWGYPPSRYYRFLKRLENSFPDRPLKIAIIGCSDGKFVLPAARRGHEVFAIDIDDVAIFGGYKEGPGGQLFMPGLVTRLKTEELENSVQVVCGDFVEYPNMVQYHAVFTSGALQYSRNMIHPMTQMVAVLQSYVNQGGYIYVDYMLAMEDKYKGRDNYSSPSKWSEFFSGNEWSIVYNRVLPPVFEKAHVDFPVDHQHHWGHLLAVKILRKFR